MFNRFFKKQTDVDDADRLDQSLVLIKPKNWLALITLIAVIAAAVVWSLFASIPIQMTALGVINTPSGFYKIYSPQEGIITSIKTAKNEYLSKDAAIATLSINSDEQIDRENFPVITPVDGELISLEIAEGEFVKRGTPIATISQPLKKDEKYVIYGYVPLNMKGIIIPGMEVQIQVIDIKDNQNETIYGVVESLDSYAEETPDINKNFLSEKIFHYYFGQQPMIQIRIDPLYAKKGLASINHNPHFFPGEMCTLRITLERKTPFKYLIP